MQFKIPFLLDMLPDIPAWSFPSEEQAGPQDSGWHQSRQGMLDWLLGSGERIDKCRYSHWPVHQAQLILTWNALREVSYSKLCFVISWRIFGEVWCHPSEHRDCWACSGCEAAVPHQAQGKAGTSWGRLCLTIHRSVWSALSFPSPETGSLMLICIKALSAL